MQVIESNIRRLEPVDSVKPEVLALEALSGGLRAVVLCDELLNCVWASDQAYALLSESPALSLRHGRLAGADRGETDRLAGLVARAASGKTAAAVLDCPDLMRQVVVRARPAPARGRSLVLLELKNPADLADMRVPDLDVQYGLTQAESEVVSLLVTGANSAEVAERLGRSILTIRTHTKKAYQKLGVTNREQLFAKLLPYLGF